MSEKEYNGIYVLLSVVVISIFLYIIVKELTKPKTRTTEIARDEQGRIIQVVEREA
ncbi:MAG: hypothetical protein ABIK73_08855 [candidate division WOR-3 bacterium]